MVDATAREAHFDFGKNWADFSRSIDAGRIQLAADGLRALIPEIEGKTFLDIGCGSGLSSLAALKNGAASVTAVDIDEDSVATTRALLEHYALGQAWNVRSASVFDLSPETTGTFDVVYSWGVLHHTGDMWRAIQKAAALVRPGGLFALALYRRTPLCPRWTKIKRFYSHAPSPVQAVLRATYMGAYCAAQIKNGRNPIRLTREYKQANRGMKWSNDIHDWLGGYPYESTTPDEVIDALRGLNFCVVRTKLIEQGSGKWGTGCDEFLFRLKV